MLRLSILLAALSIMSCSLQKRSAINRAVSQVENEFQEHFGFVLYDPLTQRTLVNHRGNRYYTPASNTKIFSLYAGLLYLGDSIPALYYHTEGDSMYFWPSGDPSFLNPYLPKSGVYQFLSWAPEYLHYCPPSDFVSPLGSGWAWSDFNSYYSSERSPFPMYANVFTVARHDSLINTPYIRPLPIKEYMKPGTSVDRPGVYRLSAHQNTFVYNPTPEPRAFRREIPYHYSDTLLLRLLIDTLKRPVHLTHRARPEHALTLYSIPADSLYKVMMQDSDNLMAEQLALLCAHALWGIHNQDSLFRHMKRTTLADLPHPPQWVDGSGLSRYNLFTPESVVKLWEKIAEIKPREELFPLLATGGVSGTLRNWYKGDETPYIFGKTGTLRNNHALSGFLVTKKGRVLIFSMMHNNYTASTNDLRKEMEKILRLIHDHN
jgi:serine-type D-Ala-D-Ala carboxypeptidase/endopeptidase (penicillin-binding protein 4)